MLTYCERMLTLLTYDNRDAELARVMHALQTAHQARLLPVYAHVSLCADVC
jgi:hypothetical protein